MTINEAIKAVMRKHGRPLSAIEAYNAIVSENLYQFNADKPAAIVAGQIRRHCLGLDFPSASPTKHFRIVEGNKFYFLEKPTSSTEQYVRHNKGAHAPTAEELKQLHIRFDAEVRLHILRQLKSLEPGTFEKFARGLLSAYGFEQTVVTAFVKDGGIDGHGKLKVGLAHLNVAFQCKRYTTNSVGRPEIDKFRGAIQGQFEQGIFFTTSSFASGCEAASFRPGAVPIVLIDGRGIVDLMIEKRFGVDVDLMPVYSYALDKSLL